MKHSIKRYEVYVGNVLVGRGFSQVKLMEYAVRYAVKHGLTDEIKFKEVELNETN